MEIIGKGSFSTVYLINHNNSDFIFNFEFDDNKYVLKKINMNLLIEKYVVKFYNYDNSDNYLLSRSASPTQSPNTQKSLQNKSLNTHPQFEPNIEYPLKYIITPNFKKSYEIKNTYSEYLYYKSRLQELIQSEVDLLFFLKNTQKNKNGFCNIIELIDYKIKIDELHYDYFLKFEYMNKGDLNNILYSDEFPNFRNNFHGFNNEFIILLFKQIINGLDFLHTHGIIHRDIKLQNIFLHYHKERGNETFHIKIGDFGFCCLDPKSNNNLFPTHLKSILLKKFKKISGTPYYMAPEIINNYYSPDIPIYNNKIDIFSLGICLYELYYKVLPFNNIKTITDLKKIYSSHDFNQNIILNLKYSKLHQCLQNILKNTLKINPDERYDIFHLKSEFNLINDADLNPENSPEHANFDLNEITNYFGKIFNFNNNLKQSIYNFTNKIKNSSEWIKL